MAQTQFIGTLQNCYWTLTISGLSFITLLLFTYFFVDNRRHPVVVAFLLTSFCTYWVSLLPLIGDVWNNNESFVFDGGHITQISHLPICRANALLGSFFWTAAPTFVASFTGEMLRIVIGVWTTTWESEGRRPSLVAMISKHDSQKDEQWSELEVEWGQPMPVPKDAATPYPSNNMVPMSPSTVVGGGTSSAGGFGRRRVSGVSVVLAPMFLVAMPLVSGMFVFIVALVEDISDATSAIIADPFACSVDSRLWKFCMAGVLSAMLIFSLVFAVTTLSLILAMHRANHANSHAKLDTALLLRIAILAIISAGGAILNAVVTFFSVGRLGWVLNLYMSIMPIASALLLLDKHIFMVWKRWLCLGGLRQPKVVPRQWAPPKPSYKRKHRPASISTVGSEAMRFSTLITPASARSHFSRFSTFTVDRFNAFRLSRAPPTPTLHHPRTIPKPTLLALSMMDSPPETEQKFGIPDLHDDTGWKATSRVSPSHSRVYSPSLRIPGSPAQYSYAKGRASGSPNSSRLTPLSNVSSGWSGPSQYPQPSTRQPAFLGLPANPRVFRKSDVRADGL